MAQPQVVTVAGFTVPAISGLRSLSVGGLSSGTPVSVQGYYTQGDAAGPRVYTYNSTSTATDDGGAVIQPNIGAGRWLLEHDPAGVGQARGGMVGGMGR